MTRSLGARLVRTLGVTAVIVVLVAALAAAELVAAPPTATTDRSTYDLVTHRSTALSPTADHGSWANEAAAAVGQDGYDHRVNLVRALARPGGYRLAPQMADDFVDLASSARRTHILRGDATGGGHLWPGAAGKTPFPQSWSGGRIMHEISDIATDPAAWRSAIPQGSRTVLTGTRGGVDIRVIVDSRTGEIISGYPTNLLRNPR